MKQEAVLKAAFHREMALFLPSYQVTPIEQVRRVGTPDDIITGDGRSTWWEFKHCTPTCELHGLQLLTCIRLAREGFCRYVIWWESAHGLGKRTMVVHPLKVKEARDAGRWLFEPEEVTPGFDHRWLARYVKEVHCPRV